MNQIPSADQNTPTNVTTSVPPQAVTKSELAPDQISDIKTIYNVSTFEIFWRNLLAGMARALGGIILYALFLFVFGVLITQLIWPRIEPIFTQYTQALETINRLNAPSSNSGQPYQTPKFEDLLNQAEFKKFLENIQSTTPVPTPKPLNR